MSDAWMFPSVPGLGGGPWFSTGTSGLGNAQQQYAQNQNYYAQQAATLQAAQVPQSQLYGGGSFGAQPAYYAGVGAAYGRAVPASSPAAVAAQKPAAPAMGSVFDQGTTPFNDYNGGANPGGFSPSPNYPGGMQLSFNDRWGNTPWSAGNGYALPDMISQGYSQTPQAASFASRYGALGSAGGEPGAQPAPNWAAFGMFGQQPDLGALYRGLGVGQPAAPATPAPDFAQRFGAAPAGDPNSFASRFAAGNYFQPGTPSQYYTGSHYPGAQAPPQGFQSLFGVDNPGGALPVGGFRGLQLPSIMGSSDWEPGESADTLTPQDRTAPGGFYGSAFNPQQFRGGMQAPALQGLLSGYGGIGSDMRFGGQNQPYAQPWHSLIPGGTPNTPDIINQINYTAGRGRYDPAALANVINTESAWNPKSQTGSYFGATQMGGDSFQEAGGRLGGMNFSQYKAAPLEQQIPAYGDWLSHYAQPGNAAGLASSGISSLPVSMQSAILQGTQFGPNSTGWPAAYAQGNTGVSTTPYPQAGFLGRPPTINSMNSYFGR